MRKDVYEYFNNLENSNIPKDGAYILLTATEKDAGIKYKTIHTTKLDKHKYYIKDTSNPEMSIENITSSELFSNCGLLCPPIYLAKKDNPYTTKTEYYEATEDLKSIKKFTSCYEGRIVFPRFKLREKIEKTLKSSSDRWEDVLTNPDMKEAFLHFMTEECYEQYLNMFLIDILRTEDDRHSGNYFLYKTQKIGSNFAGIIPIDLESTIISMFGIDSKDAFEQFVKDPYPSFTPRLAIQYSSHEDNIRNILEHLHKGSFSKANVSALKSALEYDFPKNYSRIADKYKANKDYCDNFSAIKYLWEYNQETLGKELGM
ncbi:MAG: hypothetical protein IJW59_00180 [Clostridia bacterium]|nr:hypothetical protein [Clostridia bacterium]